jgi:hypothetical protein
MSIEVLEDRELPGLLFLSPVVQSQNRLVHDAGKEGNLFDLPILWYSAQFVPKSNSDFGLEKSLLLFDTDITIIPKLTEYVKVLNLDFGTAFGTLSHA